MTIENSESLLTIDVHAEIRKLCKRRFAGASELVVELIRTVIKLGASEVRIVSKSRYVKIEAMDATLTNEMFDQIGRAHV